MHAVDRRATDKLILKALKKNYRVDLEIGEIYSLVTGNPLYRFYCGRNPQNYPFVRISIAGTKYARSVPKLLWMYSRNDIVPPGYQIHHRDLNHQNNYWRNLICLHPDDHQYLHHLLNGYTPEVVPF